MMCEDMETYIVRVDPTVVGHVIQNKISSISRGQTFVLFPLNVNKMVRLFCICVLHFP